MCGKMILLRVIGDTREGWNCMRLDEFLERIDLTAWRSDQELVGVVLAPSRPAPSH